MSAPGAASPWSRPRPRAAAVAAAGAAAGLAGCLPDRELAIVNEQCREEMPAAIYRHACQHGALGPFEPVESVAVRDAASPIVDGAQRVLDVRLPPRELDADGLSYVRYAATRDGRHAVFAGADFAAVPVVVYRAGATVRPTPIEPVPDPVGCGGMVEVTGYELAAGEEYLLELGPARTTALRIFIEHLPTFGEDWSDRCVD